MDDSPHNNEYDVSNEALQKLFNEHGMGQIIAQCKRLETCEPQSLMHKTFCCKRIGMRYMDEKTADEVAMIYHYERIDGTKYDVIRRLKIGNTVYHGKLLPLPH
jgi:hypothetical protein